MLHAMVMAEVGDDVYGEDVTTNAFQEEVAALFGKEKGLFVPSGSMSNQLALKALTQPGDEVIVEKECHIFHYETAAPSILSGVQLHTVPGKFGVMQASDIAAAIRPDDYYFARTSLVCLENTHNRGGGTIYPIDVMREARSVAADNGLHLHLDGARIWNAHRKTGTDLRAYGGLADTVSVCFSKGLGAPVGSMLLGPGDIIEKAHRFRKILGGGMRQIGVLTAACKYALDNNLTLLDNDHANARMFAESLQGMDNFTVQLERVQTNMVFLDFSESSISSVQAQDILKAQGILTGQGGNNTVRVVFHIDIDELRTGRAIEIIRKELS
jgi:threonine aldolase